MGSKFLKPGKVAIVTRGRYAGKKVVIIKPHDDGSKAQPFGHALVAGIEKYPSKVIRAHTEKQVAKKTAIKAFVKAINYNHLMPTRYTFELDGLKNAVTTEALKEQSQRVEARKVVKEAFEEKHKAGKNKWFFTKLRF